MMMDEKEPNSPIKSGWRGHLNGVVEKTEGTEIEVAKITVKLDSRTAHALCNLLSDKALAAAGDFIEKHQSETLAELGAALGRFIDHHAANNGGRKLIR